MTSDRSLQDAEARPLPASFRNMLAQYPAFDGLADALATTAPETSVRVNVTKGVTVPDGVDIVPWCTQGFYLAERPEFTFDPALHQGLYYVQDASSMVMRRIAGLLSGGRPLRWFDACAAPGGKTTAIIDALPADSLLVANEYDPRRARALVENLERWGAPNVIVTRGDTDQFARVRDFFDVVSVDAPCSGEGMMRKEAVAVSQWSEALVRDCAALQREILDNVWPTLRPGGYLVYSTCTFNTVEDEDVLAYLAEEYGAEAVDPGELPPGVTGAVKGIMPAMRFLPSRLRGEGLFLGIVRKPDGQSQPLRVKSKGTKTPRLCIPKGWIKEDFAPVDLGNANELWAMPRGMIADFESLKAALPPSTIIAAGVNVAEVKGHDMVPRQALATSTALKPDAFARVPVDYAQAIAFLRGEALQLPSVAPRGFVLLQTSDGTPLGFVKNLGKRANNLLPDKRRILSAHMPAMPPKVL